MSLCNSLCARFEKCGITCMHTAQAFAAIPRHPHGYIFNASCPRAAYDAHTCST